MIRVVLFIVFAASTSVAACTTAPDVQVSAFIATHTYALSTPIQRLVADPAAKAVLDRELPGLTTHERYDQFKGMSLLALKPFSGGLINDERLSAVDVGLKALVAP